MSALYDAFTDLANAFEARESGPAHLDRTGDAYHLSEAYIERTTRNARRDYDACDLAEECDAELVALLKAGKAEEAGRLLIQRMEATVARRVNLWVSA